MSHTMVIRQKPNVQSTDELWLQQINYLESLNSNGSKIVDPSKDPINNIQSSEINLDFPMIFHIAHHHS